MRSKLIRAENLSTNHELIRETQPITSVKLNEVSRAGDLITVRCAGTWATQTFNAKDKVRVKS